VEELDVVVDGDGQFDPGLPDFAVDELDLDAAPERLDLCIVVCASTPSSIASALRSAVIADPQGGVVAVTAPAATV